MNDATRTERALRLFAHLLRHRRVTVAGARRLFGDDAPNDRAVRRDLDLFVQLGLARVDDAEREHVWRLDAGLDDALAGELHRLALDVGREQLSFLHHTIIAPPDVGGPSRWAHLDRKLHVISEPERNYADHSDVLDDVVDALLEERPFSFRYRHSGGQETVAERAQVLTLAVYRRAVYALVRVGEGEPRCFAVERFTEARSHRREGKLPYPADWSPRRWFRDTFGVIPGRGAQRVVLRFSREKEALIRSRTWHPSQEITIADDGRVELRMRTHGAELERFVLEWGQHCEVIQPEALRRRVVEALRGALGRYGQDA